MVSHVVLNLVGETMVELRERLLKTAPPKNIKEVMKTITPPKGVKHKTAKPWKNESPETWHIGNSGLFRTLRNCLSTHYQNPVIFKKIVKPCVTLEIENFY